MLNNNNILRVFVFFLHLIMRL